MGRDLEMMLAACAPLPYSILAHALLSRRRDRFRQSHRSPSTITPPLVSALEQETGFTQEEWNQLLQDIRTIRPAVFAEMDPLVRTNQLTTTWLREALSQATPGRTAESPKRTGIAPGTLAEWEERGFLSTVEYNRPQPQQAATLVIARRIDTRRLRNWLPAKAIDDKTKAALSSIGQQPLSKGWAIVGWRQDPPSEKGAPRPAPQPVVLASGPDPLSTPAPSENATLLASAWSGVQWSQGQRWKIVNTLGVVSWAGGDQEQWDVRVDDLVRWIGATEAFVVPHMRERAPDVFQELADIVLNRVGHDLLSRHSL